MRDTSTSSEPQDRLTRICDAMTKTMDAHPEHNPDTDKCIVFLDDGKMGGIQIHGAYNDQTEAMVDLLIHLKAIFESAGKQLEFHFLNFDSRSLS